MNAKDLVIGRYLSGAVLSAALLILTIGFWPPAAAQSTGAATLTVHVTGARNTKGQIRAALFESAKGSPAMDRRPSRPRRPTLNHRP